MIQIDMEMPKSCDDCRMQHFYISPMNLDQSLYCGAGVDVPNITDDCFLKRPDWCPLQEAPGANGGNWIPVKDRLPPERDTIFAKFKGTDQWNPAMFATSSEDVRVVVQFEDGTRRVWHDNTTDGKWTCEREKCAYPKRTVTHWMPNPELPKEEQ